MVEKNKYLIFLGCAIPYRVAAYEISARKILQKLNVELVEMPEFNCCGLPIDPVDHEMMLLMAARNLAVAEHQGLDILTLCPGCSGTLRKTRKILKEDKNLRDSININLEKLGLEFKGSIEVKHLIQILAEDLGFEKIRSFVVNPLTKLKVAKHAGCHIARPKEYAEFDDPQELKILKSLIEVTGATCLDYINESECCGAPSLGINDEIPLELAKDKLDHIKNSEAEILITICPFCNIMYDANQARIEKMFKEKYSIPVLHYPQLLGLALGLSDEELALRDLRVDNTKILAQINS